VPVRRTWSGTIARFEDGLVAVAVRLPIVHHRVRPGRYTDRCPTEPV